MKMTLVNALSKILFCSFIVQTIAIQGCLPAAQSGGSNPAPANNGNNTRQNNGDTTNSSLGNINAESLMVNQNNSLVSLADIAKRSTSDITVFQFMGVSCISCMTEGPHVGATIAKYNGKVARLVIFPNKITEYQSSDYLNFVSRYANNSSFVFDESLSVIKTVRSKVGQYFGVLILVSKTGQGKIMNQDQAYLNLDAELTKATAQRQ